MGGRSYPNWWGRSLLRRQVRQTRGVACSVEGQPDASQLGVPVRQSVPHALSGQHPRVHWKALARASLVDEPAGAQALPCAYETT